ncbi:DUF6612 family protein [Paucisalibacillus sp. EB02]|uniref:DUF6612 family protein n=1 Tax=Paucisalibacillus sp. EB02 TaxID=1347087 RepID=UPI0005A810A6|nr:DUF6612 family protein [Paucisalibacillus sp. EB02]
MKKLLFIVTIIILAFGLAACSENAEDVYTKALEAAGNMESAEVSMRLNQEISMVKEGKVVIDSDMTGSMIIDPVAMHQKGTMSMTMEGEGFGAGMPIEMDTEIYYVDNEMYIFESMTEQWIKADSSFLPIDTLTANQPDVSEQLKMLEKYVEDFDFEENDNSFVYQLSADGEGFKKLSQEMLDDYLPEDLTAQMGDFSQVMEDMEIKKLYIEMVIDNETFELKNYKLDMEMSMIVEGETVEIVQNVNSKYSNINTIDKIEVPQEVIDSAVDGTGF